ncbi:MAG TPA: hypothetical protein P5307_03855 [Pirellulaceae bacterium]|nr:hypothetical protein [Pirellulaceae bacterium]
MRGIFSAIFGMRFLDGLQRVIRGRKDLDLLMKSKKSQGLVCPSCGTTVGVVNGIAYCGTCRTKVTPPGD